MVVISCSKEGCDWKTVDRDEALAAVLAAELSNHTVVAHAPNSEKDPDANVKKSPAIDRPKISTGSTEESWAVFLKKWELFKNGSKISKSQLICKAMITQFTLRQGVRRQGGWGALAPPIFWKNTTV